MNALATNGADPGARILSAWAGIRDRYEHDTAVILRTVAAHGINLFSPAGLQELADHLMNDEQLDARTGRRFRYAPRSANRILAAAKARMRQVLDSDIGFSVGQRYQVEKVIKAVKGVKVAGGLDHRKMLSAEEVRSLAAGCEPGLRLVVRFLGSTGCRISEALSIHLSDVTRSQTECTITVLGKGRKSRLVNCSLELMAEILEHFRGRSFLFEHAGKPFSRVYISQRINVVARRTIGRDHISAHCLRHAYATGLCAAGIRIETVADILGHSDASTTLRYYVHPVVTPQDRMAVAF